MVQKTSYRRTEIKCLNLPATNETLVIAPNFKKKRVQVFVKGQRANDIVKSKKLLAQAYQFIRNDYNKYMGIIY
jgi:hypothetical protein